MWVEDARRTRGRVSVSASSCGSAPAPCSRLRNRDLQCRILRETAAKNNNQELQSAKNCDTKSSDFSVAKRTTALALNREMLEAFKSRFHDRCSTNDLRQGSIFAAATWLWLWKIRIEATNTCRWCNYCTHWCGAAGLCSTSSAEWGRQTEWKGIFECNFLYSKRLWCSSPKAFLVCTQGALNSVIPRWNSTALVSVVINDVPNHVVCNLELVNDTVVSSFLTLFRRPNRRDSEQNVDTAVSFLELSYSCLFCRAESNLIYNNMCKIPFDRYPSDLVYQSRFSVDSSSVGRCDEASWLTEWTWIISSPEIVLNR